MAISQRTFRRIHLGAVLLQLILYGLLMAGDSPGLEPTIANALTITFAIGEPFVIAVFIWVVVRSVKPPANFPGDDDITPKKPNNGTNPAPDFQ